MVIGSPRDPEAERIHLHKRAAGVDVRVRAKNEITVVSKNVARLTLRLSPEMFDLTTPVTVLSGTKTTRHEPRPTTRALLSSFRRERDRRRLFADEITLDL